MTGFPTSTKWKKTLVGLLAAFLISFSTLFVSQATDAAAADATVTNGKACVFIRPNGANGAGHVGWLFQNLSAYTYGSTENPSGKPTVPAGGDIGWWWKSASFDQAKKDMKAKGYTGYKCVTVGKGNITSATNAALATKSGGYSVIGNNCMDHSYRILKAFGASMPSPTLELAPNLWYSDLSLWGWSSNTKL